MNWTIIMQRLEEMTTRKAGGDQPPADRWGVSDDGDEPTQDTNMEEDDDE